MGKNKMLINIQKYFSAGVVFCACVLLTTSFVCADNLPIEGMAPTVEESLDPALQNKQEREQFIKEIRRVENLNRNYTKQIDEIKNLLAEKDEDFQNRMKLLEDKLATQKDNKSKIDVARQQEDQTTKELENKTNEVLAKGGDLDPEDQQFKDELAKAHYNMGNIYFERGEYQRAIVEYYQAVDLAPNDADIHYNLAFVSAEYSGDQETALKHYQWYLYLKPDAEDSLLVKEKILQAKFHLRTKIDSPLDKDNGNFNLIR